MRIFRNLSMATVCLSWAVSVKAQQPAEPAASTTAPKAVEPSSVTARISARAAEFLLARRVDSVDWTDKTLEEVLDWLRDQSDGRVNVIPKWKPLGVEGVTRESTVSLRLQQTTVAEILNEVLDQLSEEGEVTYQGTGNKFTLSTREDFGRKLQLRVYDATDILFRVPDFGRGAPQIDLQRASQSRGSSGGGGGGGGSQGVFGGAGGGSSNQEETSTGQQAEQEIETRLQRLRDVIQRTIEPGSWDTTGQQSAGGSSTSQTVGGGRGRIEIHNRALIVTNTIEVHEQLAGLLYARE